MNCLIAITYSNTILLYVIEKKSQIFSSLIVCFILTLLKPTSILDDLQG